jgi:eukaryotic-like serine/threonine-protein kinase
MMPMAETRFLVADRYLLLRQLGSGGMGRVWLAHDELLHRHVALKEIVPPPGLDQTQGDALRQLCVREARAAAQLSHHHVTRVYDIVQWRQWPWIVMEYIPSRSLLEIVKTAGPMPWLHVAKIGLALVDALAAAHGAGVLHRDVAPQNVLVGETGRVVLTDFGVALWERDGELTDTELMGTAHYVAPERVVSGASTAAGDLWSLGATLYAAVEGRSPYSRPSVEATLSALVSSPPDPPRRAGALTTVLNGLLTRDPQARFGVVEARRQLEYAAGF